MFKLLAVKLESKTLKPEGVALVRLVTIVINLRDLNFRPIVKAI